MSARSIIRALESDQWTEVSRMITEKEAESLHLDFKIVAPGPSGDALGDADLGRVAKAASAFANVEGGVLVLGVETKAHAKGEPDQAHRVHAVAKVKVAAGILDRRIASLTDPPVPGVRIVTIEDPSNANQGVIAVFVPPSDGGPHQVAVGDAKGRYFIRTSTNSAPAPHSILAGLFGRQPPPRLRLRLCRTGNGEASLFVVNEGRGVADDIYVRVTVTTTRGESLFNTTVTSPPPWDRRRPAIGYRDAPEYMYAVFSPGPLYPQDPDRVVTFGSGLEVTSRVRVSARIDARGAAPVLIDDELVGLEGSTLVRVGPDDQS